MSFVEQEERNYDDGRTKQAFADSCDINKIIKKAQVTDGISHVLKYPAPIYGEFEGIDLLTAFERCKRAQDIFDDLPSEVRREFGQDAFKFAEFASNPDNKDKLAQLIPAIAEPGRFFPKPGDEPKPPRTEEVRAARALLAAAAEGSATAEGDSGDSGASEGASGGSGESSEASSST